MRLVSPRWGYERFCAIGPTAYAVGYILAPLRGCFPATVGTRGARRKFVGARQTLRG